MEGTNGQLADHWLRMLWTEPENCPQREHVLRFRDYWNDPDNMPPTRLLAILREKAREEARLRDPSQFDYLDELSDDGRLKVLRSRHEVTEVGERLHNCAASYADLVERKQGILVALQNE